MAEGGEVVGVDEEFLLQAQPALDGPAQRRQPLTPRASWISVVEGAGEPQVADVADEQRAAGGEQLHGALDHRR